jgi:hypothetical protein
METKEFLPFFKNIDYQGISGKYAHRLTTDGKIEIKDNCFAQLNEFLINFNSDSFQIEYASFFKDAVDYEYFNWIGDEITKVVKNKHTDKFVVNFWNEIIDQASSKNDNLILIKEVGSRSVGVEDFKNFLILSNINSAFIDFFKKLDDCQGQEVKKKFVLYSFKKLSNCLELIKQDFETYKIGNPWVIYYLKKLKSNTFHFIAKKDLKEYGPLLKFYFNINKIEFNQEMGFESENIAEKIYKELMNDYLDKKTDVEVFKNVLNFENCPDEIVFWKSGLNTFVAFFICLVKRQDLYFYSDKNTGKIRIKWEKFKNCIFIDDKPFKSNSVKATKQQVEKDKNLLKKFENILEKI